jgi:RNA polymerase sigma-70 factor (TIGR02960 family)
VRGERTTGWTTADARDGEAFGRLAEPYRRELLLHCYRILGSVQDAEDVVQETMLAAWRGFDRFEHRSSVRAWLYRIATNRSLNAMRGEDRRPGSRRQLPPVARQLPEPTRVTEPSWLEPYPDALLDGPPDPTGDPEARYATRESLSLAFVAALQHLPPRQRAVLVLRDALGFRAAEVAAMLDATQDSVTSLLKRARATLAERRSADAADPPLPGSPTERALVGRFVEAFEAGDVAALLTLLTDDARLTMPPLPLEYQGPVRIGRFLSTVAFSGGRARFRLVATRANGQPAFGCYLRDPHSPRSRAHGLLVLTLSGERIGAVTRFLDNGLLPGFGLPRSLPDDG